MVTWVLPRDNFWKISWRTIFSQISGSNHWTAKTNLAKLFSHSYTQCEKGRWRHVLLQNFFKFLKYIAEGTVLKMSQNCNSNSVGHLWLSYSEFAQSCPTLCDPTDSSQAPPSMGFSRQEYWSGVPFPSPGDLPDPGIEPGSPAL